MPKSTRPNLSAYFRGRIDVNVRGMLARGASLPADVRRVSGDVTSRHIVVTMKDGTVWHWSGGRYASRKINLCYAPLMPKPMQAPPGQKCERCGEWVDADPDDVPADWDELCDRCEAYNADRVTV